MHIDCMVNISELVELLSDFSVTSDLEHVMSEGVVKMFPLWNTLMPSSIQYFLLY